MASTDTVDRTSVAYALAHLCAVCRLLGRHTDATTFNVVGHGADHEHAEHEPVCAGHAEPYVGRGVTIGIGGDNSAYTVVSVSKSALSAVVQHDHYFPLPDHDGPYGKQSYRYEPNPEGHTRTVYFRSRGRYRGRWGVRGGGDAYYVSLTGRREYRDPSF